MNCSGIRQRVLVWAAALAVCPTHSLSGQPAEQTPESAIPGVSATHVSALLESSCVDCHDADTASGQLAIPAVGTDLSDASVRERFALMHDRVAKGQMPPDAGDLPKERRAALLAALSAFVEQADRADVTANGRVPLRRLNRHEYEHTLRDILQLPNLDIGDRLPEDRTRDGFNKSAEGLDFSRIQLEAALDAAEAALRAAVAEGVAPQPPDTFTAISKNLFAGEAYGSRRRSSLPRIQRRSTSRRPTTPRSSARSSAPPTGRITVTRAASWRSGAASTACGSRPVLCTRWKTSRSCRRRSRCR